jgi:hypothetical protein
MTGDINEPPRPRANKMGTRTHSFLTSASIDTEADSPLASELSGTDGFELTMCCEGGHGWEEFFSTFLARRFLPSDIMLRKS